MAAHRIPNSHRTDGALGVPPMYGVLLLSLLMCNAAHSGVFDLVASFPFMPRWLGETPPRQLIITETTSLVSNATGSFLQQTGSKLVEKSIK